MHLACALSASIKVSTLFTQDSHSFISQGLTEAGEWKPQIGQVPCCLSHAVHSSSLTHCQGHHQAFTHHGNKNRRSVGRIKARLPSKGLLVQSRLQTAVVLGGHQIMRARSVALSSLVIAYHARQKQDSSSPYSTHPILILIWTCSSFLNPLSTACHCSLMSLA